MRPTDHQTSSIPKVWQRMVPLGEPEAIRGLGGTVSPLLAGFSLVAIAQLTSSTNVPPLADWAIAAFSTATAFLLMAMQFSFMSLRYAAPISERLAINPRAEYDRDELEDERKVQHEDIVTAEFYKRRTYGLYDIGLISFLVGLMLLLWRDQWSVGTITAFAVAAGATVVEVFWGVNSWSWNREHITRWATRPVRSVRTWMRHPRFRLRPTLVVLYEHLVPVRDQIKTRGDPRIMSRINPAPLDEAGLAAALSRYPPGREQGTSLTQSAQENLQDVAQREGEET